MIFCTKCGAKLPDGSKFCEECGAPVEAPKSSPTPPPAPPAQTTLLAPDAPQQAPNFTFASTATAMKPKKKLGGIILLAVVALAVLAAVVFLVPKLFSGMGGGSGELPIVYVKDGDTLRFTRSNMKEPATITSSLYQQSSLTARISKDGKKLLYLNDGSLYLRNVDSAKPNNSEQSEKGEKLASDVSSSFFFTSDGKYIVYAKEDGDLYYHDGKESTKLDSEISEYGGIVGITDQNRIVYMKSDGDENIFYTQVIGSKNDSKLKIDSDVSGDCLLSEDGKTMIYTKNDEGEDGQTFDCYLYTFDGEKKEKIVSGANEIHSVDPATGTVVYGKNNEQSFSIWELVEDDMASADAAMTEPNSEDFKKRESGIFGDYETTDYDAYQAARDKYSDKEMRDSFREVVADGSDFQLGASDLYCTASGKETKLATGAFAVLSVSTEGKYAVYVTVNKGDIAKIKLNDFLKDGGGYTSGEAFVKDRVSLTLNVSPLAGGEPVKLTSLEKDQEVKAVVPAEDGSSLCYLIGKPDKDGELYYSKVTGGKAAAPVKVDDDVSELPDVGYQGKALYFKDEKDASGDLYAVNNGTKEKLDSDVFTAVYTRNDGDVLLYSTDMNTSKLSGDLNLFSGSKKKLSSDVHSFYYRNDKLIYLLKDYNTNSQKGDLYCYTGGDKLKLIEYDVTGVVAD